MNFESEYKFLRTKEEFYKELRSHQNDNTIWFPKFIVVKSGECNVVLASPISLNLINGFGKVKIQGEINGATKKIKFARIFPYGLAVFGFSVIVFLLIAPTYIEELITFRTLILTIMPFLIIISFLIHRWQQKRLLKNVLQFLKAEGVIE